MPGTRIGTKPFVAAGIALLLFTGACSSGSESGSDGTATQTEESNGSTEAESTVTIAAQPDDKGEAVLSAIDNAKTSVDIVVYEMNGPGINDALVSAVKRGVDVRVILNGQWWTNTTEPDPTYYKLQFAYDLINEVAPAASGSGAGTFTAHWASNNFNITHQKTVIIDAVDSDGKQYASAADLPDTASTVILTGNLNAYKYDPTDPSSCPQPCEFYGARDFYLTVTDADLVFEVEKIFSSDFACDGSTVTNDLEQSDPPLTWSNGSTGVNSGDPAHAYPANGFYPYFPSTSSSTSPDSDPGPGTDQGNVRERTIQIIDNATKSLMVYNEEMGDPQTIAALVEASKRLGPGKVQIVMTENSKYTDAFTELAQAGAEIHLFKPAANVLYIHAKVIMADESTAYIGSTNISGNSMNFNRELGMVIEDAGVLQPVIQTFQSDFNSPDATPFQPGATLTSPDTELLEQYSQPEVPETSGSQTNVPMPCGVITVPSN